MPDVHSQLSNIKTRLKDAAKEAGNVLFMILIAVALFAALAYAVTQSTRSGGGNAEKEQNLLTSSQVIQYPTSIENSIMRMKVSNNCTDDQISFENPIVSGYTNPNAPANYTCHVFRPEGGGVPFQNPPANINGGSPWYFTGRTCVVNIGTGGSICYNNDTESDLVAYLPNISKSLCAILNEKLGVTNPSGNPPVENGNGVAPVPFLGTYNNNGLAQIGGSGDAANLNGKRSGCFQLPASNWHSAGQYIFYHVLIPR